MRRSCAASRRWLNLRNHLPPLRRLAQRMLGIAASRPLPAWRRDAFRDAEADALAPAHPRGEVLLLADTFNRYFEPENLRAALRVLAAAGYRAVMPPHRGRPLCCGRTFLAAGMLDQARAEARRTMGRLGGDLPVIGLEPSCLLTLRDEFRSLLPGAAADALAGARDAAVGVPGARKAGRWRCGRSRATAHVHGHCHQKSFGAFPAALAALQRVPDLAVKPIVSSCCGMAGSFGYQAETQDVSRAMAEASLLPAVRAAAREDLIVADGTSCRHQIRDLARTRGGAFGARAGARAWHDRAGRRAGILVRRRRTRISRRRGSSQDASVRRRLRALRRGVACGARRRVGPLGRHPARHAGADRAAGPVLAQSASRLGRSPTPPTRRPARWPAMPWRAASIGRCTRWNAVFVYLPFEHSEDLADQDESVRLFETLRLALGDSTVEYAYRHRDVIRRFGRFPHRNAVLGRESTRRGAALSRAAGRGILVS